MDSQANASAKPLNILCLDGGGVRGLSSLLILGAIMEGLQTNLKLDAPPLPCEIFDLICGTSTGGLIALMLGRLRMSVEEAIACYCQFSKEIFGSTLWFPLLRRLGGQAMYDASNLEKYIKDICRKHEGNEEAPLRDPRDTGEDKFCRVFVVAVTRAYADAAPRLFRSYETSSKGDKCAVWEAARATTAATTFFDPIEVGYPPETLIDGGLSGANNPSKLALQEVRKLFPGRPIGCFLSVGTGVRKVISVSLGYLGIAEACARLITECEVVADNVRTEFGADTRKGQDNPHFRFSVLRGVGNIKLDKWTEMESLVGGTRAYLREDNQESDIKRCVKVLSNRTREAVEMREERLQ